MKSRIIIILLLCACPAVLTAVPKLETEILDSEDRSFLSELMKNTWDSLEYMIDDSTGLPRDKQEPGGLTNTTNIGLYLASLCIAEEVGYVTHKHGKSRVEKIVESLESYNRVKGFMPNFVPVDLSERDAHGIMMVSDFNKLATGLIMARQKWPEMSMRITRFLDAIEWSEFYDAESGMLRWGFDLDAAKPVGEGRLWLTADTRSAVFMMIASGAAPPEVWARMDRQNKETKYGVISRGYGMGGLFLHAMDGLFLPEIDTEVGESAGNMAWQQIKFAQKRGYPLWGWSNCFIPESGYTEGGFLPERVVTPNAVALVAEYYPRHVTAALREMVNRGGTIAPEGYEGNNWGLRDAYDMESKKWDHRYLSLDQGMVFLSLANLLHDQMVRRIYTSDPLVKHGLKLLEPHIVHRKELLEKWKKRDSQPIIAPSKNAHKGVESVEMVSLKKCTSSDETQLKIYKTEDGHPVLHATMNGATNEVIATISCESMNFSHLKRIEIDMELITSDTEDVGELRMRVVDRFGQERLSMMPLEKNKKSYVIQARDLHGIFLDEENVTEIKMIFWKNPWFYTERKFNADSAKIRIDEIRIISAH